MSASVSTIPADVVPKRIVRSTHAQHKGLATLARCGEMRRSVAPKKLTKLTTETAICRALGLRIAPCLERLSLLAQPVIGFQSAPSHRIRLEQTA